jgi:hypothetical protein
MARNPFKCRLVDYNGSQCLKKSSDMITAVCKWLAGHVSNFDHMYLLFLMILVVTVNQL